MTSFLCFVPYRLHLKIWEARFVTRANASFICELTLKRDFCGVSLSGCYIIFGQFCAKDLRRRLIVQALPHNS